MSKKSEKSKKSDEEKLLYLALTFFLGPAVIGVSTWTLNVVGVLAGLFLEAWGIWGMPEIHPYLKLVINWKGRKSQTEVNESPGSKVVSVQGDVGGDIKVYQGSSEDEKEELRLLGAQRTGDKTARMRIGNFGPYPVHLEAYAIGAFRKEFLGSRRLIEPGKSVVLSVTVARTDITKFETGKGYYVSVWSDMGKKFNFGVEFY